MISVSLLYAAYTDHWGAGQNPMKKQHHGRSRDQVIILISTPFVFYVGVDITNAKFKRSDSNTTKLTLYMFDLFTKEKNQVIVHFFPKTTATFFG